MPPLWSTLIRFDGDTTVERKQVTIKIHGHKRRVTRKVRARAAGTLVMPTTFTAQNGIVIHQNTPISVTGCTRR